MALFARVGWPLSVVAYMPFAVLLATMAVASVRHPALPIWIGWLSAALAGAHIVTFMGIAADRGPGRSAHVCAVRSCPGVVQRYHRDGRRRKDSGRFRGEPGVGEPAVVHALRISQLLKSSRTVSQAPSQHLLGRLAGRPVPREAPRLVALDATGSESLPPSQFPLDTTNGSAAGICECFERRHRRPAITKSRWPVHNLKAMKNSVSNSLFESRTPLAADSPKSVLVERRPYDQ